MRERTKEQGPSTPSQTPSVQIDPSQHFRLFQEIQAALTADEDGDVPLHLAVVHEHIPLVQKFIQLMKIARKSVDRFNKDKQTPLHLAVKLNFLGGVKALLEAGADVNFVDKTGCTSLHLAVKHQLPECLRLLVSGTKEKADFNTRNFEGLTPLHTAVELKNKNLLTFILDHGADINMMDGKSGRTPMFHAAENNEIDMVELLLKRGGNPDVLNYAGSTAIMAAQARNFNQITKMLSRASEWNDEEGSGTSSPASEVSVYLPDPGVGVWKHSVPLRNPATTQKGTTQTAQTFPRASSSVADDEVSLTQTSAGKSLETVPGIAVSNSIMDKSLVMEKSSSEMSRTLSGSPKINSVTADDIKGKEQEKGNSNNSAQPVERTTSLRSSELNVVDFSKLPPQLVHNMMQKIIAAKQQMISSSGAEKRGSGSVPKAGSDVIVSRSNSTSLTKDSSADQTVTSSPGIVTCQTPASSHQPVTSHPSVMSHPSVVSHPAVASRLSVTSQVPVVCHPSATSHSTVTSHLPVASHSSVFSQAVDIVTTRPNVTSHSARNAHPAVTSHQISRQNVTPSPPSTSSHHVTPSTQIVGKVSQVIEKLPQQPERIISTGMVVEHPEFGLVFRPFSAGHVQKLNQPESVLKTHPPSPAMRLAELPVQEVKNVSEKNISEKMVKKSKSQTDGSATTSSSRKSGNGDTTVTSSISDAISSSKEQPSHPVTEKLLNSKPKSTSIPKSRPESHTKSQPGAPAADTNQVKSIANSAIAAKLRQRVLNSPHVDSATKALANATVTVIPTTHSSETVTTAPERVPKLPQFSPRPLNIAPNSKILEQLSKPRLSIDGGKLNSDGSEQNADGGKKTEKKKRKVPGSEMKKKTVFIKSESEEKTSSRLDNPVNVT